MSIRSGAGLLAPILLLLTTMLPAQFQLRSQSDSARSGGSSRSIQVRYFVSEDRCFLREPSALSVDPEGGLPLDLELMASSPRPASAEPLRRSCLLALPAPATNWTVSLSAGEEAALEVEPVTVGTFAALKLTIHEDLLPLDVEQVLIDLSAEFDSPDKSSRIEAARMPREKATAEALFLNGVSLGELPLGSGGAPRALPSTPGTLRVTYPKGDEILRLPLASLGITAGDVSSLRIVHHGDLLATGGVVGSDLWIYAPRRHTLTDLSDSVFATPSAGSPSPAMTTRVPFPTLAAVGTEVAIARSRTYDLARRYERGSILPLGDRFVYWRVQSGQTTETLNLAVGDVFTSTTVGFRFVLLGFNFAPPNPDHFADLLIQGVLLPRQQWEDRSSHVYTGSMNLPSLPNPASLTIGHAVPVGSPFDGFNTDVQNLDVVELSWTGYPRVDSSGIGTIDLPAAGAPRRITVGGFPAGTTPQDVILLDITNPALAIRVVDPPVFTDVSGTRAIEFEAPAAACHFKAQRIAVANATATIVAAEQLPAVPAAPLILEAIHVRPPTFDAALDPLGALSTDVVLELDPQAAYNAYNGGQQSPDAIAQALADILQAAPLRIPFPRVLLAGHASLDPRNYLGLQSGAKIPTFIEDGVPSGGISIENPEDYPYATLLGADEFEDVQVGRIPAKTTTDLARAVSRSVSYAGLVPTFLTQQRLGLFVTDDRESGETVDFSPDIPDLVTRWEDIGRPSLRIDIGTTSNGVAERAAIRQALESGVGPAFVLFTGHGNVTQWASESIWNTTEMATLANTGKWPIVATFTCLNGYYALPTATGFTMAESWLFQSTGGSVANIAPSGADFYAEQRLFAVAVMDRIASPYSPPDTVGDLMLQARTSYLLNYPSSAKTARGYVLFGDPASALAIPQTEPPQESAVRAWDHLQ